MYRRSSINRAIDSKLSRRKIRDKRNSIIPRCYWRSKEGRTKLAIHLSYLSYVSLEMSLSSKNISIQSASRIYILAGPVARLSPNRRITGCLRIYYCYYYFVSLRSSPPASLPPSPSFFLLARHGGEAERGRQTQGRHSSCGSAHVKIRREYFTFRGARAPRRQRRGATSRGIHFEIRIYTPLRPGSRE